MQDNKQARRWQGFTPWMLLKHTLGGARQYHNSNGVSKYADKPLSKKRECARRRRQIERGMIEAS